MGRKRSQWAIALLGLGLAMALLDLLTGSTCYFRAVFGVPCPGCGLTRAMLALARGNWALAFHWHPLWPLAVVLMMYLLLAMLLPHWLEDVQSRHQTSFNRIALGLMVLFVSVYGIRMVLYFPTVEPMTLNDHSLFFQLCHLLKR